MVSRKNVEGPFPVIFLIFSPGYSVVPACSMAFRLSRSGMEWPHQRPVFGNGHPQEHDFLRTELC